MARAAYPALALLALLSLGTGASGIGPLQLLTDPEGLWLLAVSRLPRTVAALLAGAGLAVAGVIMQMLARNRFVEPATAGTGEAAGLGLVAVTLLAPASAIWLKMLAATATALAGTAGFLAMVRRLPPREPLLVPLTGIVYGGILGAATTFLAYERDLLQYIGIWMNGEFSGVMIGRYEYLWISGGLTVLAYLFADRFTIAGMGRDMSVNLGLSYGQVMAFGLFIVSVITALTVVTVGMIPFVGLVVPNIVSRIRGDNLRHSLPIVALSGAALVLACDVLARVIRYPYEIPVGTVLGIVGGAIFLWLLHSRGSRGH
ncbi:iron chelate uptake ABC transporter family permease subunit [Roseicyclus sp. F158]|uniref:Iron chelate uptake ABC transporter family permease subunit n=1 Tax=Tropicimonas omnivorans TaxID=3075590 RepID=A0ABU3DFI6_9RHOB|nr:iron chelate uptake ABC transporter family permease subunit [Roseicyclus sp. F158]MDT0682455.1 iron chelate uptake ABC transporter family permease subunit [Roseicyclus sp. F158]